MGVAIFVGVFFFFTLTGVENDIFETRHGVCEMILSGDLVYAAVASSSIHDLV